MALPLLDEGDPPPFVVENADGASEFLLVCDHAGRAIPRRLARLGLDPPMLETHIAWDLGIAETSRALANELGACLILQSYSRLVIDCNRWPGSADSIVDRSERVSIPGNAKLDDADIEARTEQVFLPYHDRIREELDRRQRVGRRSILVAMHSFTPVFMDEVRPWHAGVLHHADARIARALLTELRTHPELCVGENQPYAATEETDYAVIVHAERRGLPYVEVELRHDLIADRSGRRVWAARLARGLEAARRTALLE